MNEHQTTEVDATIRAAHAIVAARYFLRGGSIPSSTPSPDDIAYPIAYTDKQQLAKDFTFSILYTSLQQYYAHSDQSLLIAAESSHRTIFETYAYLERALSSVYPEASPDTAGLTWFCQQSRDTQLTLPHTTVIGNPHTGGALSVAYGMTLHNPQHRAVCFIDDTIAEMSSESIAWHTVAHRSTQAQHGAIMPILLLSQDSPLWNASIYELLVLFIGRGYDPQLIDCMADTSLTQAHQMIAEGIAWLDHTAMKYATSTPSNRRAPRQPLLIVRPPRLPFIAQRADSMIQSTRCIAPSTPDNQYSREYLTQLFTWCRSGLDTLTRQIPHETPQRSVWYRTLSPQQHTRSPQHASTLSLPPIEDVTVVATPPGSTRADTLQGVHAYLRTVQRDNHTSRFCLLRSPAVDAAPFTNTAVDTAPSPLFSGIIQGYLASGGQSLLLSHPHDVSHIASAIDHYQTLLPPHTDSTQHTNSARLVSVASYNQLIYSSPQQPLDCLDEIMRRPYAPVTVYVPADANCAAVTTTLVLTSRQQCNIICAGARNQPSWLTTKAARSQMSTGLAIWNFASHPEEPHIVLAGVGDTAMTEIIAAIKFITTRCPAVRIRCINISSLTPTGFGTAQRRIPQRVFNRIFTKDKPIIINFIGRPHTMSALLGQYAIDLRRVVIHGHTIPMPHAYRQDALLTNHTSRYDIALSAVTQLRHSGVISVETAQQAAHAISVLQHAA